MKKHVFLISFTLNICITAFLYAQQVQPFVITTNGNTYQNNNVQISYTVGETVVYTLTSANSILTQGYQQPHYNITLIPQHNDDNLNISIYPNPTTDELYIHIISPHNNTFTLDLYDLTGKRIYQNTFTHKTITLPLQQVATGKYILTITSHELKEHKTFEIIKIK